MRLKGGFSETQNAYFWDSKCVFLRLKLGIFETQTKYSESILRFKMGILRFEVGTQNGFIWDSNMVFLRFKIGIWDSKWVSLRLKHGIFKIQNRYSETQNRCFWDSKWANLLGSSAHCRMSLCMSWCCCLWALHWVSLFLRPVSCEMLGYSEI